MNKSKIEWTDATWNPVEGCTPVSEGCRNCYAASIAHRFSGPGQLYDGMATWRQGRAVFTGKIRMREARLLDPCRWRKPRRVFVNSMSDLFHEDVPFEYVDKVFAVMALCPQHTFQILTKRPERMANYLAEEGIRRARIAAWAKGSMLTRADDTGAYLTHWPLPNVWLGTSTENQAAADERIPHLLRCPASVRFLSCEPLLGPVDLVRSHRTRDQLPNWPKPTRVDWVIVGGESGKGARPMHPAWVRSLRDQCVAARVPFFFKQWGEWCEGAPNCPSPSASRVLSPGVIMGRFGKKLCGRKLDGRAWDEMPEIKAP